MRCRWLMVWALVAATGCLATRSKTRPPAGGKTTDSPPTRSPDEGKAAVCRVYLPRLFDIGRGIESAQVVLHDTRSGYHSAAHPDACATWDGGVDWWSSKCDLTVPASLRHAAALSIHLNGQRLQSYCDVFLVRCAEEVVATRMEMFDNSPDRCWHRLLFDQEKMY